MIYFAFLFITLISGQSYDFEIGSGFDCPAGCEPIPDLEQCQEHAAEDVNPGGFWDGEKEVLIYPTGCYIRHTSTTSRVGFNVESNPQVASNSDAVCQCPRNPTFNPSSPPTIAAYIITAAGANTCPDGYEEIDNVDDCRDMLGTQAVLEIGTNSLPSGCIVNTVGNKRFNENSNGSGHVNWKMVCATTTPTPTNVPTLSQPTSFPTSSHPTHLPTSSQPTSFPTSSHPTHFPTPSQPTSFPTSSHPTHLPTPSQPTSFPTSSHPTHLPTTPHPTHQPTLHPTTSQPTTSSPTESPTFPADIPTTVIVTDNVIGDLESAFGGSLSGFLSACTDALPWSSIQCADAIPSGTSGKAVVTLVSPVAEVLSQATDYFTIHGLYINNDVTLYPLGFLSTISPTGAPSLTVTETPVETTNLLTSCPDGKNLITIDAKVGFWYDGTITQLWSLAGYQCEHMSGYPESDFGQYTTHTKTCCLPPASYTLTCSSGPTFGWKNGNIKINGVEYCNSDALSETTSYVETHQVDLCDGTCAEPPASFFQLEESCDSGFIPEISMAIGTTSESSAGAISWKLTDACKGDGYSPQTGEYHQHHEVQCCLPKGKYTLTCSASGIFTWQKSFILINGRQYCYNSLGGESHIINMCDSVGACPDFTTNETGEESGSSINIGSGDDSITITAPVDNSGAYNDDCGFALDGECDEPTGFCDVGTDCTDCGNCLEVHDSGSVDLWVFAVFTIMALTF